LGPPSPAVSAGGFTNRHVLVIGIDGCRADALQAARATNLLTLATGGTVTWNGVAGGILGTPTQQPTVSGPGWASIVTGVWTDRHGIVDNSFAGYQSAGYPHFFQRVREHNPAAFLSSIVEWSPIDTYLVGPVAAFTSFRQTATDGGTTDLASKAAAHLTTADPDVLFLHFDAVDLAGHSYGFSPAVSNYLAAIETVDRGVGTVLAAMRNRPGYASEKWLVIVTTDHGGAGTGHGGQSTTERDTFLIVNGEGVPPQVVSPGPGHTAVPPTVLAFLGVPIRPEWNWADPPFGVPHELTAPVIQVHPTDQTVTEGMDARFSVLTAGESLSFQWRHDGQPINGGTNALLLLTAVQPFQAGAYSVVISNAAGFAISDPAALIVAPAAFRILTNGLLTHLPFDGAYLDVSSNGRHARPVGGPSFGAGQVGSGALRFDSRKDGSEFRYASLGAPLMAEIGTNSFSAAFWIRFSTFEDDPPFLSNKDWDSGANTGFVIAAQPGGTFKHNFRGAAGTRVDGNGGPVADDQWHHIAVTYERGVRAVLYRDGVAAVTNSLTASPGTIDSGLPLNIGQDGTGSYTYGNTVGISNALLDDLGIWRRALSREEVEFAFQQGRQHVTFDQPPRLMATRSSPQTIKLSWTGPGLDLQATTTIPGSWATVPGATNGMTIDASGGQAQFYRLVTRSP